MTTDHFSRASKMNETGKPLERLVKAIEKHLLPEGFTISSNERVFEHGVQIAEFDIVISGRLGSTNFKWLIECRDRPSDGPAPGSWIEQLVARRSRFNFDKVIAVSTTGFAQGAEKYAAAEGIPLRTVNHVTELTDDFKIGRLRYKTVQVQPPLPLTMQYDTDAETDARVRKHTTLGIRIPGDPNFHDFERFILWFMHREDQVKAVNIDYTYLANFEVTIAELQIDGTDVVTVERLKLPVEVQIRFLGARAIATKVYAEDGRLIGQEVQFESMTEHGSFLASGLLVSTNDDQAAQIKALRIDSLPGNYILDLLDLT